MSKKFLMIALIVALQNQRAAAGVGGWCYLRDAKDSSISVTVATIQVTDAMRDSQDLNGSIGEFSIQGSLYAETSMGAYNTVYSVTAQGTIYESGQPLVSFRQYDVSRDYKNFTVFSKNGLRTLSFYCSY